MSTENFNLECYVNKLLIKYYGYVEKFRKMFVRVQESSRQKMLI